jgi:hypothetical protein
MKEEAVCLMVDRNNKERKELGFRYNLQKHCLLCLLLPFRPHLLMLPLYPKIAPPSGDHIFHTWACGDHFTFKP